MEKQNIEMIRVKSKLRECGCIQSQLNEELDEKTEQICQMHSENSKLVAELGRYQSELNSIREREEHLVKLLDNERNNVDDKAEALEKCNALLQMLVNKNEDHKMQNETLNLEVI